jgi:hypothetical protein
VTDAAQVQNQIDNRIGAQLGFEGLHGFIPSDGRPPVRDDRIEVAVGNACVKLRAIEPGITAEQSRTPGGDQARMTSLTFTGEERRTPGHRSGVEKVRQWLGQLGLRSSTRWTFRKLPWLGSSRTGQREYDRDDKDKDKGAKRYRDRFHRETTVEG